MKKREGRGRSRTRGGWRIRDQRVIAISGGCETIWTEFGSVETKTVCRTMDGGTAKKKAEKTDGVGRREKQGGEKV